MEKTKILKILKNKVKQIDSGPFDLDIHQRSLVELLNNSLGLKNLYAQRIKELSYSTKDSYDNLYPEKVNDVEKTKDHLQLVINDIVAEIDLLDEESFSERSSAGSQTLEEITGIIHKYLNGEQIEKFKKTAKKKNKNTSYSEIVEHLRELDGESTLKILSEILNNDEIWDHI